MNLDQITKRLSELRTQTESADMEKAELFAVVKHEKMYADAYGTFAHFCESIGYTRQHVYSLLRIEAIPEIKAAHADIGTMAANAIASAAKTVTADKVVELLDYAKSGASAHKVIIACKAAKAEMLPAAAQDEPETLQTTLVRQRRLLQEKSDVEARLADINTELADVYEIVKRLTV